MRTAIGRLAALYALKRRGQTAYGLIHGCRITLSRSVTGLTLSLYVGALEAPAPGSDKSPTLQRAESICALIQEANGDNDRFGLGKRGASVAHGGSLVTMTFRGRHASDAIQRFVPLLLPQIAPMTAPMQCIHCGGHTGGAGQPVRLAPGMTVPMHAPCLKDCQHRFKVSRVRRIPGKAVLLSIAGALIGCLLHALCYGSQWLWILAGLVTVALAELGCHLGKAQSGVVRFCTAALTSTVALALGAFISWIWPLHQAYAAYGDVVHGMMREITYIRLSLDGTVSPAAMLIPLLLRAITLVVIHLTAVLSWRYAMRGQEAFRPVPMPGQA